MPESGGADQSAGAPCEEEEEDRDSLEDPWNLARLALGSFAGESWRTRQALIWPSEASWVRPLPEGSTWWEQYRRTQSYDDFRIAIPFRPNTTNNSLEILLVGDDEALQQALKLESITAHLEAFLGLRVTVRPAALKLGPWARPRRSADGYEQVGAHFLLAHMEGTLDIRSTCTIGLTTKDLYPPRSYDFVTGMTDKPHRVGVFSLARYFASTLGPEGGIKRQEGYQQDAMLREVLTMCFVKSIARESLKLCGMGECHLLSCLMNPFPGHEPQAVNELPLELCCICLRKLQWITQADLMDRFARLPAALSSTCVEETSRVWERMQHIGLPTYVSMINPDPSTARGY